MNNNKTVIISGMLFVLFMIGVLPHMSNMIASVSMSDSSPDTFFSFQSSDFFTMIEEYTTEGRRLYIIQRWTFDIIWPLVYGVFLSSCILVLTRANLKLQKLYLLPILGVGLDIIENTLATVTMAMYPSTSVVLFYILRIISTLKWATIGIAMIMIVYLVIQKLIQRFVTN